MTKQLFSKQLQDCQLFLSHPSHLLAALSKTNYRQEN